jgi:hypothetical protein
MIAQVRWATGGQARVVSIDARAIALVSSVAIPPGSPVEGTLEGEPPARLRVKVHASRKLPDGSFRIEGRPIDMSREVRERLEALVSSG